MEGSCNRLGLSFGRLGEGLSLKHAQGAATLMMHKCFSSGLGMEPGKRR